MDRKRPEIITIFKFLKLNQRISVSVQGTPRRGNEHIAQGIALGYDEAMKCALKGQKHYRASVYRDSFALSGRNSGG